MSHANMENRVKKARKAILKTGHIGRDKKEKLNAVLTAFLVSIKPPPKLDLDDWMDKYFYLPSEAASEHGRWRTSRFPFLRKIAKKLSPSSVCREIGVCKGAQLGLTTIGVGWNLYIADHCPAPTMYVQPTTDTVKEYSEQKLDPSIAVCDKVKKTLGSDRPTSLTNTKLRKYFPGGYLALASANSAPSMRSKSIKNLQIDEEDACNQDVNKEGSSVHLAIRRTSNFSDKKIFRLSTPIEKMTSSIEPFCNSGTAERFLVPCPDCNPEAHEDNSFFEIKWELIKYENNDPRTACLCCPECGALIEEHHKTWMLENAFWYRFNPMPLKAFSADEKRLELLVNLEKYGYNSLTRESRLYLKNTSVKDEEEIKCTFFISSLYSPLGFYSWQDATSLWLEANRKNDKSILKIFKNTVLGQSFSTSVDDVDFKDLRSRKELISMDGSFDLPSDLLFLTCGIDVQKDRLEAKVLGTGEDDEEWVIDYKVFYGDTSILGDSALMYGGVKTCWGALHEYLQGTFKHQSGHELPIECTLIDCRYRSQYVFAFCRTLENVFAVRGMDGWGKGFIERPTKKNKYGVWVFHAFSDELKVKIYSQLRNTIPGPNYTHFSRTVEYPTLYFKGLVIEELKVKRRNGTDVHYWENPPGGRNEPLDTYCYAKAALLAMRPSFSARAALLSKAPGQGGKPRYSKKTRVLSKGV